MNNGVSKKLTITGLCMMSIMTLAQSDTSASKMGYCIIIGVLCVAYLIKQTIIDLRKQKDE